MPSRLAALAERFYPESRFGGFSDVDGTVAFYLRVAALLPPGGVAVDVGCGRGTQEEDPVRVRRELRVLRGHCRHVVGIDVDPRAAENPSVDEFRLMSDPRTWPLESASADLVLADFVLEHVEDPGAFLAECARVLRPGGHACLRTVNARSYVGIASRMVPNRLHRSVLARVHDERDAEDVFPTLYRCNTRRRLATALESTGFDATVCGYEAEPVYLAFSSWTYRLGVLYGRLAPQAARGGLHAFARRRAEPTGTPLPAGGGPHP